MKLENWSVVAGMANPYQAPEQCVQCLHGTVYGHPRFEDGSSITTSRIVRAQGGIIETFSGSLYELGEVDPVYGAAYPNAKQRLILSVLENGDVEADPVPEHEDDAE